MSDSPTLIPLPGGGMARLREPQDLTARHTRGYQVILQAFGVERFQALIDSQAVAEAADTGVNDEDAYLRMIQEARLDYRESELLARLNDAVIYKWLADLKGKDPQTGRPYRVPASVDEVQDLPEDVMRVLAEQCGRREQEHMAAQKAGEDGFGPAGAEDPNSPFGGSNDSSGLSALTGSSGETWTPSRATG